MVNALGDLAPRQREVLVLRYYGGLSEAEIAEACQEPARPDVVKPSEVIEI